MGFIFRWRQAGRLSYPITARARRAHSREILRHAENPFLHSAQLQLGILVIVGGRVPGLGQRCLEMVQRL